MPKVFIGVGSNLGDRKGHFEFARRELSRMPEVRGLSFSPVYETEPVAVQGGPFLNAVWSFETELPPADLLKRLQVLESAAGRLRCGPGEARTLDLDILFYGDQAVREGSLTVPHPRLHERTFVLQPFCDLAPNLVHPVLKKTMKELLCRVERGA